ncbi:MAG: fatty acid metabolism transcriptional regulator FadR [Chloroflexi bacterium]|nr:fatty acid metabolism transcriptional regulator FadR [Anaerolineaceae bacterium]NMB90236.1 fatty acid metabolism transcriptional regulator FadR [Chloroflexota bacterium]
MNWNPPGKPAELSEERLIEAILSGHFPAGSNLPAERELAVQLGVTRPTLREALQRLARDGWLEIHHGRPTRVRNYWEDGNLAVLGAIARHQENVPVDFVSNLLYIRKLLAPSYTSLAVSHAPQAVLPVLQDCQLLGSAAEDFAAADWNLHKALTIASGNPVFTLILNGFQSLYSLMGLQYFSHAETRQHSRDFYAQLLDCIHQSDAQAAGLLAQTVMAESLDWWRALTST